MKLQAFFLGDDPAMDFLNTIATPQDSPVEFIGDGRAYVGWLVAAKLLRDAEAAQIYTTFSVQQLDDVAREARLLREWFREQLGMATLHAVAPSTRSPQEWLQRLNSLLVAQSAYKCLVPGSEGWTLVECQRYEQRDQLLTPVAEVISRIFIEPDLALIKRCANPECTLWFRDRSKAHSRMYCSPALCGNRAKVAAYRTRQKKSRQ